MLSPQRIAIPTGITHERHITIQEVKSLNLPLTFLNNDKIIIERSLNGWKLKTPITIELKKVLAAKEIGLVDYIIRSCLNERPSIIPYIFEYQTMLKLAARALKQLTRIQLQSPKT